MAFVDRADVKALVGPPGTAARYDILASCVAELARVRLVTFAANARGLATARDAKTSSLSTINSGGGGGGGGGGGAGSSSSNVCGDGMTDVNTSLPPIDIAASAMLWRAATGAKGFSGRALRKLPLAAHALHARSIGAGGFGAKGSSPTSLSALDFCSALVAAVDSEKEARAGL